MARITVEDCLKEEQNRFALVQLAARRTKQLLSGSQLLVEARKGNKSVVNALREIAAGQVRFKTEEDLQREREEAMRRREEELRQQELIEAERERERIAAEKVAQEKAAQESGSGAGSLDETAEDSVEESVEERAGQQESAEVSREQGEEERAEELSVSGGSGSTPA